MIAKIRPQYPARKKRIDWVHIGALLFGWLFVIGASCLLGYLLHNAPREGRLVCDTSVRPTITQFGTCHVEPY